MTAGLDVQDLIIEYAPGVPRAVDGVSFAVEPGAFFTLLGPSGCGKTSTLRAVAGLETPAGGRIVLAGETLFDGAARVALPPNRRDLAMVFQSYAIWPHMTAAANVSFPLEAQSVPRAERRRRVAEALALVGLADFAGRSATQLSGGQQQRVALARAIVKGAKLLLLDEPLSNLDAKLREEMRDELRGLQRRLGQTTLYVTHDQDEALTLSTTVAVMNRGRIVEMGEPEALYLKPRRAFTARFLGQTELWPGTALGASGAGFGFRAAFGDVIAAEAPAGGSEARWLMVRPEHIEIVPAGAAPAVNVYVGRVVSAAFGGRLATLAVEIAGQRLVVLAVAGRAAREGESVRLHIPPERAILIGEE
jgi:iron(III) transport system ATP-binding protein